MVGRFSTLAIVFAILGLTNGGTFRAKDSYDSRKDRDESWNYQKLHIGSGRNEDQSNLNTKSGATRDIVKSREKGSDFRDSNFNTRNGNGYMKMDTEKEKSNEPDTDKSYPSKEPLIPVIERGSSPVHTWSQKKPWAAVDQPLNSNSDPDNLKVSPDQYPALIKSLFKQRRELIDMLFELSSGGDTSRYSYPSGVPPYPYMPPPLPQVPPYYPPDPRFGFYDSPKVRW